MKDIRSWQRTNVDGGGDGMQPQIDSLYFLVHAVDASGAVKQSPAWMFITFGVDPNSQEPALIAVCSPRCVSNVIRGFMLTLPPPVRAGGC